VEVAGRVAIVTGGASGIGAAVVERLDAAGARPVVWDLQRVEVICDVADERSVGKAMQRTISSAGAPSIMVTCAGVGSFSPIVSTTVEEWERVLGINLRGTMLCIRAAAQEMRKAAGGAIVCISSINATLPDRGMAAYCCSKAAVEMLTRVAAGELARDGIRVNCVAPGVTDTPLEAAAAMVPGFTESVVSRTPLAAIGRPEQVADAVMALIAADWVTGQILTADGGLTLSSPLDAWAILQRAGWDPDAPSA
jgi:NAD(P)-dependent dehydrogenase (short-subunit alcohol dehydrogenase family)